MPASNHFDVIIVGTGAGGGTLAYRLAPSGKRVLLLERGDYVPREKENWNPKLVNLEGRYQTEEHWKDRTGNDLHPRARRRGRRHGNRPGGNRLRPDGNRREVHLRHAPGQRVHAAPDRQGAGRRIDEVPLRLRPGLPGRSRRDPGEDRERPLPQPDHGLEVGEGHCDKLAGRDRLRQDLHARLRLRDVGDPEGEGRQGLEVLGLVGRLQGQPPLQGHYERQPHGQGEVRPPALHRAQPRSQDAHRGQGRDQEGVLLRGQGENRCVLKGEGRGPLPAAEARHAGFENPDASGFDYDAVAREWARYLGPSSETDTTEFSNSAVAVSAQRERA